MKDQLTIKELAPYLPYGLKWLCYKNRHFQMTSVEKTRSINSKEFVFIAHPIDPRGDYRIELNGQHNEKPLIRSLSDLTKEIEHNGERFVPGLALVDPEKSEWDKMTCEFYNPFPEIPNHKKWIRVTHSTLGEIISINPYNIEHLPHHTYKNLIEWHFDVFGLIDRGLAIDINTITK